MKQFMVITCIAFAVASCNNEDKNKTTSETGETKMVAAADVKLPIPLEKPYRNWQIGSTENVVAAMNALKAYVDKDYAALAAVTGDSLEVQFDNYYAKMSRDSAMKFFSADRPRYNDLKITMYDYVSVISADKTEEWVTLWYKQAWKNEKGVADSLAITDDVKLKNGKMIELDEKTQHIPAKK